MRASKSRRQAQILAELDRLPSLRVADLAERLAVSTETIRRDLDELTGQGRLNRTYGGAVRMMNSEPAMNERHALHVVERQRIAAAVVGRLAGARVVMIGSGSTTLHVARQIAADLRDLTVITHGFAIAAALSANASIKVVMAPGEYHAGEGATVGVHTTGFLSNFFADVAVLGASGLTEEGPNDALIESAAVYTAMTRRAARTLVAADHSKFGRMFPARYSGWSEVAELVSDSAPDGAVAAALAAAGVAVTPAP
ncbi:DeoR/GlpR family DNA-binding transcription regulator [Oharaeibacter diazotrophicus]|uniref:DeoR family transcriptional regulator n=1 Tax=Oharaeibacter diazotrophicus TaxID=1920512 RepID=A0A4R6RN16_9HYPH|nr:DeoR/GlpR family DNA-binding transcription regulator [Oharaeibacter diazotrophicus]TDP87196.1 DeoR family transcriptional regulator [Oharaeibacter diazotrophicus]BBE70861.1 glycerol-3-phosphate regulon repressor [Pleomorphomonas sp. SM30]GLS77610.1 DeoR family transcriptional regulator [Oharaeibacter diazotrophicus]